MKFTAGHGLTGGRVANWPFVVSGSLQLRRTPLAHGIAVDEKANQQKWMVSSLASAVLASVSVKDGAQIESVNDISDKPGEVAFGQPVLQGRAKEKRLIQITGPKSLHWE